jgi:hypothetical protein
MPPASRSAPNQCSTGGCQRTISRSVIEMRRKKQTENVEPTTTVA